MTSDVQLHLSKLFSFEFLGFTQFLASISEEAVTSLMYTNEALWQKAGQVAMIAFDIGLTMGGSEALVESFYSVMDTQRKVKQNHATLENRAILDWSTRNVLRLEDVITKAAKIFVDGDREKNMQRHRVGCLKKKGEKSSKVSKVLKRIKDDKGRYHFLA